MAHPVGPQKSPPGGAGSVVDISEAQDAVIADVVRRVMGTYRNPPPKRRPSRGNVNPGTYAVATSTISAASGLTLGYGTITLCTRDGRDCTPSEDESDVDLPCYNAGGEVDNETVLSVNWVDGDWSPCVAPCPDDSMYGGY